MGATIHYRKTSKVDPHLKCVGAPSSFMESLTRAFGHFPCEVSDAHIPILQGMAALGSKNEDDNPYLEVIELIEKIGSIELYASW